MFPGSAGSLGTHPLGVHLRGPGAEVRAHLSGTFRNGQTASSLGRFISVGDSNSRKGVWLSPSVLERTGCLQNWGIGLNIGKWLFLNEKIRLLFSREGGGHGATLMKSLPALDTHRKDCQPCKGHPTWDWSPQSCPFGA